MKANLILHLKQLQNYMNFNSLSFGLTNGAAAFQRSIDVIEEDELENPFAYVDNITVCSMQIKRSMTLI